MGGLGNQMFQYALGKAISIKKNLPLKLDLEYLLDRTPRKNFVFRNYDLSIYNCDPQIASKDDIENVLGGGLLKNIYINKLLPISLRRIYSEKVFEYDKNVFNLKESVYLDGYWQSYKYFEEYAEIIKSDFSINCTLNFEQNELVDKISKSNSVCVNVRRADFLNNAFHGVCDIGYYERGLKYISERVDNLNIFVF